MPLLQPRSQTLTLTPSKSSRRLEFRQTRPACCTSPSSQFEMCFCLHCSGISNLIFISFFAKIRRADAVNAVEPRRRQQHHYRRKFDRSELSGRICRQSDERTVCAAGNAAACIRYCRLLTSRQLGLLHNANGVSSTSSAMMVGTQLK